jgi:hypothetical protein
MGDGASQDFGGFLNHHAERTRFRHRLRILHDHRRCLFGSAAYGVAPKRVHCLRGQTDMGHHGHAPPCEEMNGLGHDNATF